MSTFVYIRNVSIHLFSVLSRVYCSNASRLDLGLRYRDLDLISVSSVTDTVFEARIDISSISIPALLLDDISVKSL